MASPSRRVRKPFLTGADNKGSTVGVMTHVRLVDGQFAGRQGLALMKYLELGRKHDIAVCIFDPADVDIKRHVLQGYVLRGIETSQVIQREMPIPLVIYDQILSRRYEQLRSFRPLRAYLQKNAKLFNNGYFDKWDVDQWLKKRTALLSFLPETYPLRDADQLHSFLMRHPVTFIKPTAGSLGIGILRVIQKDRDCLAQLRERSGALREETFKSAEELFARYQKRFLRPHILQQGLTLIQVNGCPVDLRVVAQKNRLGIWCITKQYARKAASGEFVSNLTTGGEALRIGDLERSGLIQNAQSLRETIKTLTMEVCDCIEEESHTLIGELGLDFGIAPDGHLYVIEVNSKPFKSPVTELGSEKLLDLSFLRPLRFAQGLSVKRGQKGVPR
ncbi:YheC/YheD family endospore coat-associated protein [Ferroacidibacillus organovorans]|uniref:ATP-grasp domain-containing protein n=1 Tax=Ferroacidibacillus organovorans TaxID=1765683 RepID=A0A853KAU9_9BACL|nr:YheC/YheD family protein [Ferroacidibacillus organovorans]KYP82165.1 hypothetical protein AYJ22_00485 [Ferroacidibacillus organovorans]OAG93591.1 hypothetical protein AYW79_09900 [Ferroacidibacillus organovorans]